MKLPSEDKFWARVNKTETCWLWTGRLEHGYGAFLINRKSRKAHRISYELIKGSIPDGLTLDHLCKVKNCVNPAHLEPVTAEENLRRHWGPHCPRGHLFTPENTGRKKSGARVCLACGRERAKNRQLKEIELLAWAEGKSHVSPSKRIPNLRRRRIAVRVARDLSALLTRINAAEIGFVS